MIVQNSLYKKILDHLTTRANTAWDKKVIFTVADLEKGMHYYNITDKIWDEIYVLKSNGLIESYSHSGNSFVFKLPEVNKAKPVEVTKDDVIVAEVLKKLNEMSSQLGHLYKEIEYLNKKSKPKELSDYTQEELTKALVEKLK